MLIFCQPLPGLGCSTAFGAALGVLIPTGGTCAIFNIMAWYLGIYSSPLTNIPSITRMIPNRWNFSFQCFWLVTSGSLESNLLLIMCQTSPHAQNIRVWFFWGGECFKIYSQTTKLGMFDGVWGGLESCDMAKSWSWPSADVARRLPKKHRCPCWNTGDRDI